MGYYLLAWFVGLLTGAGGLGFLWWRYNARVTAFLDSKGLTLPR